MLEKTVRPVVPSIKIKVSSTLHFTESITSEYSKECLKLERIKRVNEVVVLTPPRKKSHTYHKMGF